MLLELNHKWDVDVSTDCCSENVEIIFSTLHSTICDFVDKALRWQGHNVISHIIVIEAWILTEVFLVVLLSYYFSILSKTMSLQTCLFTVYSGLLCFPFPLYGIHKSPFPSSIFIYCFWLDRNKTETESMQVTVI